MLAPEVGLERVLAPQGVPVASEIGPEGVLAIEVGPPMMVASRVFTLLNSSVPLPGVQYGRF